MGKFGVKTDDPTATGGGGDGSFIRSFKPGETTLRFLQEMDPGQDQHGGWTIYWEHFDQAKQRSFPCTGDRPTCPGCTSDNERTAKASKKYLVNAVRVDGEYAGYTNLYKVPVSAIDDLIRYAEKDNKSITMRDYTIVRYEKDNKTKYSVDRGDKYPLEDDKHAEYFQDHQKALLDAYVEANGEYPPGWEDEPSQDTTPVESLATTPKVTVTKTESSGLDEFNGPERVDPWHDKVDGAKKDEEDLPPTEPVAESESDGEQEKEEEQVNLTTDEVRAMDAAQLRDLFVMCGLPVPDTDNVQDLADQLIAAVS